MAYIFSSDYYDDTYYNSCSTSDTFYLNGLNLSLSDHRLNAVFDSPCSCSFRYPKLF